LLIIIFYVLIAFGVDNNARVGTTIEIVKKESMQKPHSWHTGFEIVEMN
jgi:hypothetical protein